METYRIAVDTLGADIKSSELIEGALQFCDEHDGIELTFIGRRHEVVNAARMGHRYEVCHEFIQQTDPLIRALRYRTRPSMRVGLELLRDGKVDGFVSTGNTAALMALSRQILSMLSGIERPAIIKEIQALHHRFWMLDLGANITRKSKLLVQFARLGSAFASGVGRVSNPRVALLNIGAEDHKGPEVIRTAAEEIAEETPLNFVGFIEADKLFQDQVDIVVADGFAGNIALKTIEGMLSITNDLFLAELSRFAPLDQSTRSKATAHVAQTYNPQKYNGASFVGLNGVVVKAHGATDRVGIGAALQQAVDEIKADVPRRVSTSYQSSS